MGERVCVHTLLVTTTQVRESRFVYGSDFFPFPPFPPSIPQSPFPLHVRRTLSLGELSPRPRGLPPPPPKASKQRRPPHSFAVGSSPQPPFLRILPPPSPPFDQSRISFGLSGGRGGGQFCMYTQAIFPLPCKSSYGSRSGGGHPCKAPVSLLPLPHPASSASAQTSWVVGGSVAGWRRAGPN